ncbi:hypothetical protein BDQ17DRAFT_1545591 [Cyathus striatus]|nr:hypothetical protein BDQ17DRAFT_1545591 [Cyathus striatus]
MTLMDAYQATYPSSSSSSPPTGKFPALRRASILERLSDITSSKGFYVVVRYNAYIGILVLCQRLRLFMVVHRSESTASRTQPRPPSMISAQPFLLDGSYHIENFHVVLIVHCAPTAESARKDDVVGSIFHEVTDGPPNILVIYLRQMHKHSAPSAHGKVESSPPGVPTFFPRTDRRPISLLPPIRSHSTLFDVAHHCGYP